MTLVVTKMQPNVPLYKQGLKLKGHITQGKTS